VCLLGFICIFLSLLCISSSFWSILKSGHATILLWCLKYCHARSYLGWDYLVHLFLHHSYNFLEGMPSISLAICKHTYISRNSAFLLSSEQLYSSLHVIFWSSIIFTDGLPWCWKFSVLTPIAFVFLWKH